METARAAGEIRRDAAARLAQAGCATPALDARALLAFILDCDSSDVIRLETVRMPVAAQASYNAVINRRLRGEPVAYITGACEFWSLPFAVSHDTLIPRPDSETLIEAVLMARPGRDTVASVLDLGTGSGCLLLSLLTEYHRAHGVGLDISAGALSMARRNAAALHLQPRVCFVQGSWAAALEARFDILVTNPPYIDRNTIGILQPEVRGYEPHLALDGGADGLEAYRDLVMQIPKLLAPDGVAVLEIGATQAQAVRDIAIDTGAYALPDLRYDLAGHPRCIILRLRSQGR